jgi:hypothetical protein
MKNYSTVALRMHNIVIYKLLCSYLADNSYHEFSPHNNQFSIDLSNPVHIEVNSDVKRSVSEVPAKQWKDEAWRFPRTFG